MAPLIRKCGLYSSSPISRKLIHAGEMDFTDVHLSAFARNLLYGFYGEIDVAVVEVSRIRADGSAILSRWTSTATSIPHTSTARAASSPTLVGGGSGCYSRWDFAGASTGVSSGLSSGRKPPSTLATRSWANRSLKPHTKDRARKK